MGLQLSLVQLPGYGDSIDNTECWHPVRSVGTAKEIVVNSEFTDTVKRNSIKISFVGR